MLKNIIKIYIVLLIININFTNLIILNNFFNQCDPLASNITVNDDGGADYTKIQDAINASKPGDIIYIWAGTYFENIIIPKNITLIGNGTETTKIIGNGNGNVIYIKANWVNISGLNISGSGSDPNFASYGGIKLDGVNNCKISNNYCYNNENGISLNNSNSNIIINNMCYLNNWSGVFLSYSDFNNIINNTCNLNERFDIKMYSSNLNKIKNNTLCSKNNFGIDIYNSNSNIINYNNCTNHLYGIHIAYFSTLNVIINNTCILNKGTGIFLEYDSNMNTIAENNCLNNNGGISLYYTNSNKMYSNTMFFCGIDIGGNLLKHWNTHDISINNTVNNKKVYYWKNVNSGIIPINAGQVILANCSKVIVENQNNSETSIGIKLGFSNDNIIRNNNCSRNENGIEIWYSNSNKIENNICIMNRFNGIELSESDFNNINNNTCFSNSWYGIAFFINSNNIINNNTCNSNYQNGIFIFGTPGYTSDFNIISNNSCIFNNWSGIELYNVNSNTVINNKCNLNNLNGIILNKESSSSPSVGNDNIILNNTFNSNNQNGIFFSYSILNIAKNNSCSLNNENGIYLLGWFHEGEWYDCKKNEIINNFCNFNKKSGIKLECSRFNTLKNNSCTKNQIGINLNFSESNNIFENNISYNYDTGILINSNINKNNIYRNNIIDNNNQAIDYGSNYWYINKEGNYWSDYNGLDNGANERIMGDGIGDTDIPHLELDSYPFIKSFGWLYPGTPLLQISNEIDSDGNYSLSWNETVRTIDYILEESNNSTFNLPLIINEGWNWKDKHYVFRLMNKSEGTYYYRLKAYNQNHEGNWSVIVNVIVDYPPNIPQNFSISVYPYGNVLNLSWNLNLNDTKEYYIEYMNESMKNWDRIGPISYPGFTYNHTGLNNGERYYYRIQAMDHYDQPSNFSKIISGIPWDSVPPVQPTGLRVETTTKDSISLIWNPNTEDDLEGYHLFRSKISNPSVWGDSIGTIPKGTEKFIDLGLDEKITYYYVITAFDEVPNNSSYSNMTFGTTILGPYGPVINNSIEDFSIPEDTVDDSSINLYYWFKDINNDPLKFKCENNENISVTIFQENGTVIIIPKKDWNGKETLIFYANDSVYVISDDVTITITPVNDPPGPVEIISPEDGYTVQNGFVINFSAICTDPDLIYGDILLFIWRSNFTGIIGKGEELKDILLPIGKHTIKLIVSDLENKTSNTSIHITVIIGPDFNNNDTKNNGSPNNNIIIIILSFIIIFIVLFILFIWFLILKKGSFLNRKKRNKIQPTNISQKNNQIKEIEE